MLNNINHLSCRNDPAALCRQKAEADKQKAAKTHTLTTNEGLMIIKELTFCNWSPGQRLTRNILLKNVATDPISVTYSCPTIPEFKTSFPKKIDLFTGNTYRVTVTFEPTKKKLYEDSMRFLVQDTVVTVCLRADLPRLAVRLSEDLVDFQERPCGITMHKHFQIINCGELPFRFKWSTDEPFTLSPSEGQVSPSRALTITVTFHPSEVAEYQRTAVAACEDDDPESLPKTLTIELRGRGRCAAYLLYQPSPTSSNRIELDFGVIAKKQTATLSFSVFNTLCVDVPFVFHRKPFGSGENDQKLTALLTDKHLFHPVEITSGILKGETWTEIPVVFRPDDSTNDDTGIVETFIFSSQIQDASMTVRCLGHVESSSVSASVDLLNFGVVFLHQSSSLHFKLDNQGLSATFFQFDWADSTDDVFRVDPLRGSIGSGQSLLITVQFHPLWPMLYRKMLRCLVHNEGVICIDVIGSCHSSLVQPPLLKPCHLETFSKEEMKELISMGPRFIAQLWFPKMLKNQVECGLLRVHTNHTLEKISRGTDAPQTTNLNDQLEQFEPEISPYQAWFSPQQDAMVQCSERPVTLDKDEILFGYVPVGSNSSRIVRMTSQANEPLIVNWTTQQNEIFHIEPASTALQPRETLEFSVTFSPNSSNLFFQWQATCHLVYEFLSSFQLVEEFQVIPPLCLSLSLSGHCATLTARRDLRPSLRFIDVKPPINFSQFKANGRSFATFIVMNPTANTIMYRFEKDSEKSLFLSPRCGVMEPGDQRLIVAYLASSQPKTLTSKDLSLILNDNEDSDTTQTTTFKAFYDPEIRVTIPDTLIFPETFLDLASSLPVELSSDSAFPLRYHWFVPDTVGRYLEVSPSTGVLISHDSLQFVFTFTPHTVDTYRTELVLRVTAPNGNFQTLKLGVAGRGTIGHLSMPATGFSFNNECRKTPVTYTFQIRNDNNYRLRCRLIADVVLPEGYAQRLALCSSDPDSHFNNSSIRLAGMSRDDDVFDLPAFTHEEVNFTFSAEHCGTNEYHLYSEALSNHPSMQVKRIGTIKLRVSQPMCQVVDIVGTGSMRVYGKERLWRLLHISQLNKLLNAPANDEQDLLPNVLNYKGHTVPEINCASQVDISLGAAVVGQAGTVRLALQNEKGPVCSWKVIHLADLEIKVKEISPISQLPDEYVSLRKKKLVCVSPSHGSISEGATTTIDLHCSHAQVGEHLLPFFLQIDKGKLILVRVACRTLSPTEAGLVICRNELRFDPSPLSSKNERIQMCEMYNPTMHKINFEAIFNHQSTSFDSTDKDDLKIHEEEEVTADVFRVLNSKGQVGPQSFAVVAFTFKPQHLTYSLRHCIIKIHNGQEYLVRIRGHGCSVKQFLKMTPHAKPSIQPTSDWILPESEMLQISTTQLDFGFVPLFSLNQRVIFVQNVHKEAIRFKWHDVPETQTKIDQISIEPRMGLLRPGETAVFAVSWDAHNESSQFTHAFALHFTEDARMSSYLGWLHTWMAQVRERCLNFIITDKNPTAAEDIITALEHIEALHPDPCPAVPNTRSGATPLSYPSPAPPPGPFTGSYPCPSLSSKSFSTSLQADPVSSVFQHLLSLLESRPNVKVPPLQHEPPIHRLHFSVAGHSIERSLFVKAFPDQSVNFFFRSDERRDLPAGKPTTVPPQYSAIATQYLSKVIHSILSDNFKEDVQEVLNVPPTLYYADMLDKSSSDEGQIDDSPEIYNRGSGDSQRNRQSVGPKRNEDDEEPTGIYAVSPRVTLNRQTIEEAAGDQDNREPRRMLEPTLSELLDCAENQEDAMKVIQSHHKAQSNVLRSTTYQLVARDLFHDIIASILKDCRNYNFDLFDKPHLQLEDNQLL